jgi:hypothetical protein
MSIDYEIARIFDAVRSGRCISELIADDEIQAGRRVVRPGEATWLPEEDWESGTVCSLDGKRALLILLHSREQGKGAFTRLITALYAAGKTPFVIAPTWEFQKTLMRHGWRPAGLHGQDAWRKPRRAASRDHAKEGEAP